MKRVLFFASIALCAAIFSGCGSVGYYLPNESDMLLFDDDYKDALDNIEAHRQRTLSAYRFKNEISLLLDKGLLSHYAGDYSASSASLQEAQRLMEEAFTKSLTGAFKRAMGNNVYNVDYPGEDFEDIYVNIFCALNYYKQGNTESALVEIRRLNEKLVYIYDEYERGTGGRNTWSEAMRSSAPNDYKKSALGNYLGMLFWRGSGNLDSARIDAQRIGEAYKEYPNIYKNPLPRELVMRGDVNDELAIPANMARLNVLSFTGLSPYKDILHSYSYDDKFDSESTSYYLTLNYRPSPVNRVEIVLSDGRKMNLSLLESMSSVICQMYLAREFYYSVLGILTEASASFSEIYLDIATALLKMFSIAPEYISPRDHIKINKYYDLRMGSFLPGNAWVGGINLSPGTYSFTVNYYSGNTLVSSRQFKNQKVEAGKLNLVEDFLLKYDITRAPESFSNNSVERVWKNLPNNLSAPRNVTAEFIRTETYVVNSITTRYDIYDVKWNEVPGALWYLIYRSSSRSSGYVFERNSKGTSTRISVKDGHSTFRIVAVGNEGFSMPSTESRKK